LLQDRGGGPPDSPGEVREGRVQGPCRDRAQDPPPPLCRDRLPSVAFPSRHETPFPDRLSVMDSRQGPPYRERQSAPTDFPAAAQWDGRQGPPGRDWPTAKKRSDSPASLTVAASSSRLEPRESSGTNKRQMQNLAHKIVARSIYRYGLRIVLINYTCKRTTDKFRSISRTQRIRKFSV
jgi:hypothetical protein